MTNKGSGFCGRKIDAHLPFFAFDQKEDLPIVGPVIYSDGDY
jgi:hypothetical protein